MSINGASAKALEVYHTVIKRERLSGILWLVWSVLTLGGGIAWKVLFKKGAEVARAAFEAAMVEGGRTWAQHEATIGFISGLLIFVGALSLFMAIFRLVYAWDMKRDPVGIYSHYQMRLKGRIVFLVLGCVGGSAIAVYDIFTRKYVIENREYLIEVVNAHLDKVA